MLWSDLVDTLRALIFGVAHVCNGSVGVAVVLVSLTIRLALLPLTLRLARRAREHQQRLRDLKPALDRLKKRYANDPAAQMRETAAFFRRRGVKQVDSAGILGALAQAPIFMALYSALRRGLGSGIRFLWIGDTAVPNWILTIVIAGLTTASVALAPVTGGRGAQVIMLTLTAGMTIWFLSSTSALFALSTGAGAGVAAVQNWLIRKESARR